MKDKTANLGDYAKPGAPGGPGRPKGSGHPTFITLYENAKANNPKAMPGDLWEIAMQKIYAAIDNGEEWAIKFAVDHGVGKPRQSIDIEANVESNAVFHLPKKRRTEDG